MHVVMHSYCTQLPTYILDANFQYQSVDRMLLSLEITYITTRLASFPGPAQLSVAISTVKRVSRTASDEKLGGAWERGYH